MAAADILGEMRDARSVPPLRAAADHDPSASVRNHAIDSLAGMCDAAVIADTRARLHAADEWQRAAAVHRLGRCNSPETVETLRDVLLDPAQPVAAEAESALRRLGSVR